MAIVHRNNTIIIGSGSAGYTAAIYAARAGLKTILAAGPEPGGQLTLTTDVENYPGFADVVQGPWLMEQMKLQVQHLGTELLDDMIVEVDFSQRPFRVVGASGDSYISDTVIICTGAQVRWLGIPGEDTFRGRGVSACATCDGFFYRDKVVAVIGGGNVAVTDALLLAKFARQVTLVCRDDELDSEKILQDRLFKNPKIAMMWNHAAEEILGAGEPKVLNAIRLRNVQTGSPTTLSVDGVFVAIGRDPLTAIFKGHVVMDNEGYILTTPDSTATSVAGVFAAGDAKDRKFRQAITAAGMGCMAAIEAERFLSEHEADAHLTVAA